MLTRFVVVQGVAMRADSIKYVRKTQVEPAEFLLFVATDSGEFRFSFDDAQSRDEAFNEITKG